MDCKHTAEATVEFGDVILEVTCSNHGRVIDTVVPKEDIARFLFVGSIGVPPALFLTVVRAFNAAGVEEAAQYLPN